ncbi:MAG TPA: N-acetylmuramoyl-L-alanine amidase-like domain-containing protein [Chthoniobacterales bacterium]
MRLILAVWSALSCLLIPSTFLFAAPLPFATVFRGDSVFAGLVRRADQENWRVLPLGERTAAVGRALQGTPYRNFTLEIDDHTEAPSVDFLGMDCWTYFEVSLGFARMLEIKNPPYTPNDLLALIELDRYRGGRCTGSFTSRLHHLEDWLADNERRGLVKDLTRSLGGVPMTGHYEDEMSTTWRRSRYLRNNPELVPAIRRIESNLSARTIYHIPKARVAAVEPLLRDGDVICISSSFRDGFTEHVGLALRDTNGALHFMHASKDARSVIIDVPLHQYLYRYAKFGGIMVARPLEVPASWHVPLGADAG